MTLVMPTEDVMFGQFCNFAEFLRILALLNWVTLEYISSPSPTRDIILASYPTHVTVEEAHWQHRILLTQSSTLEP